MVNLLEVMDKFLCKYLGLNKQSTTPNAVTMLNNDIFISNTESFKRHSHSSNWVNFASTNLNQLDAGKKKTLGIAMGKAIAKHLSISFDEIKIK